MDCDHYQRSINIYAECCHKWFPCHICHNNDSDHEIDRSNILLIKCLLCETEQKISECCININCTLKNDRKFCYYVCILCGLYSNDQNKDIYHCDQCGICRIGPSCNYSHCTSCKLCYPISIYKTHKCTTNRLDQKCSICQEDLFSTRNGVSLFDKCTHAMCIPCHKEYIKTNYRCPICRKSIYDMSEHWLVLDNLLINQILPIDFISLKRNIICADCDKKSINVTFDFEYHKCTHCGSYNTNII